MRKELGIEPKAALLGQVAQITPWKGQDTSIRALGQLRGEGVNAHLLIVGNIAFSGKGVRYDNHAYLESLHRLVDELALQDSVHFLGQRRDVPGILRELDLSLLPSWDEPFANVMLESMAMETPLLVSSVGGGPELVEDGVSGRVLPPKRPELWASAVRDLLGNREALARMGTGARAATASFSDEVHARDMLDVYECVLAQPQPDPASVAALVPRAVQRLPQPRKRKHGGAAARATSPHSPSAQLRRARAFTGGLGSDRPVKILLANHTSAWSGAEVSLMRLVAGLRDEHDVASHALTPGGSRRRSTRNGIQRMSLPMVDASLRLHPVADAEGPGASSAPAALRSRRPRAASRPTSSTPTRRAWG